MNAQNAAPHGKTNGAQHATTTAPNAVSGIFLQSKARIPAGSAITPIAFAMSKRRSVPPVLAYTSGTNRTCDIHGVRKAGLPIGVDVSKLSESGIRAILESKVPILLDSGAFGEVTIQCGEAMVTRPISDQEWTRRLDIYLRITRGLCRPRQRCHPPAVTVIAPDQVGSQEATLERLKRFRADIKRLRSAGAEVVVPMQAGDLRIADFYHKVTATLGFRPVPAMPMKKAPQAVEQICQFLQDVHVRRLHFLGIGPSNGKLQSLLAAIRDLAPCVRISMDSNRIRAAVGQRRLISVRERENVEAFIEGASGEVDLRTWHGPVYDMTELLYCPSHWLHEVTSVPEFAQSLRWLASEQRHRFAEDPDAFLAHEDVDQWLTEALMDAYWQFLRKRVRPAARCKAVAESLGNANKLEA
jgi:hypothetical protein